LLWNLLDSAGGGLAFWSVGYAFAYGGDIDLVNDGVSTFVGTQGFFMQHDTIRFENWFYQFAFACAVSCKS
jgi:ammonium transporter, Amt family